MLCVVLFRSAMLSSSALPLLDKAREELVENDYDHAEQSIRAALQVLFERRIAQFREQQQLSKAMSLAVELTQLRPSEASGYQWQGDLLAEQCCYSKAATIYSEGFAKTQVESLRVASEAATARHNVKIDPLRYLPPEIIPLIFSHVPQQRVRCLSVCKEWHQRLFMISSIWRNLHFYYRPSLRAVSMTGFRRVIGASLDTLTVTTKSGACAAFRLIRQSDYRYIRKLILKDSTRYKQSASLPPKFIREAGLVGRHLTELTLQMNLSHNYLLRFILTVCPRLVRLELKMNDMITDAVLPISTLDGLPEPTETDLQYLYWTNAWFEEGVADANFLGTYCPKLQIVSIDDYIEGAKCCAFTEIITSRCPELQALNIGVPSCIAIDLKALPARQESKGLRALLVNRSYLSSDNIYRALLRVHQDTLEHFEWAAHDRNEVARSPAFVPLPNLKVLSLVGVLPKPESINSFISHCSKLTRLRLTQVPLSDTIVDAILALPQLETIEFVYHHDHGRDPFMDGFQRFLSAAIEQGENCHLRHFSLFYVGYFPDNVLASIGRLRSISVLRLGLVVRSDKGLRGFVENARTSGLLKRLDKLELSLPPASIFEDLDAELTIHAGLRHILEQDYD